MSYWIVNNAPDRIRGNTSWTEYTDTDIVAAWSDEEGQGHRQAVERGRGCIVVKCDQWDAISLSRLFIRNVFAIATCCHYDWESETLSLYCGDAGSGTPVSMNQTRKLVAFWPIEEYVEPCRSCGSLPYEHFSDDGECP